MANRKLTAEEVIIVLIMLDDKEVMQLFDEYKLALNSIIQKDAADFPSESLSIETLNSIKNKGYQILDQAIENFGQGENDDCEDYRKVGD